MTMGNLTWEQAVLRVLGEAQGPLHYTEVRAQVARQGLTRSVGANPASVAMNALRSLLRDGQVAQTGRGIYALPDIAQNIAAAEAEETIDSSVSRLIVSAYGLYWSRNLVNWEPTSGQLLGSAGVTTVNFADQDGIYMLHNGNEIAYVGQSYTPTTPAGLYRRLRDHHTDARKSDRWDTFPWFGFRPVNDNGELSQAPDAANIKDVIDLIEGIFIEGMMPRLNMRRGDGTKAWEANLYSQVEDPQLIASRFAALAQVGQALR